MYQYAGNSQHIDEHERYDKKFLHKIYYKSKAEGVNETKKSLIRLWVKLI